MLSDNLKPISAKKVLNLFLMLVGLVVITLSIRAMLVTTGAI